MDIILIANTKQIALLESESRTEPGNVPGVRKGSIEMKWFTARNLNELKEQYRELAKQHHPDCGGTLEDMQEINSEYETLSKVLAHAENDFSDEQQQAEADAEKYRDIINKLIHFPGLNIEICGRWIWVSGNTYPARTVLKESGFYWASKKHEWYWHTPEDKSHSRKDWSMDKIRNVYGSQVIKPQMQAQIA